MRRLNTPGQSFGSYAPDAPPRIRACASRANERSVLQIPRRAVSAMSIAVNEDAMKATLQALVDVRPAESAGQPLPRILAVISFKVLDQPFQTSPAGHPLEVFLLPPAYEG